MWNSHCGTSFVFDHIPHASGHAPYPSSLAAGRCVVGRVEMVYRDGWGKDRAYPESSNELQRFSKICPRGRNVGRFPESFSAKMVGRSVGLFDCRYPKLVARSSAGAKFEHKIVSDKRKDTSESRCWQWSWRALLLICLMVSWLSTTYRELLL